MAEKNPRIAITLPDDLYAMLTGDAEKSRMPIATRLVQIVDVYYQLRNKRLGLGSIERGTLELEAQALSPEPPHLGGSRPAAAPAAPATQPPQSKSA